MRKRFSPTLLLYDYLEQLAYDFVEDLLEAGFTSETIAADEIHTTLAFTRIAVDQPYATLAMWRGAITAQLP